jgi:hypothetical protein
MSTREMINLNVYCPVCGRPAVLGDRDVVRCGEGHATKIEVVAGPETRSAASWRDREPLL